MIPIVVSLLNAKKEAMKCLYIIKHMPRLIYDILKKLSFSIYHVVQHTVQTFEVWNLSIFSL